MKKYLVMAMMLFLLIALVACNGNNDISEPESTTQIENNQIGGADIETPIVNLPTEPTPITQNENNQAGEADSRVRSALERILNTGIIVTETPIVNLPTEELKIQIDVATDSLLSTFTYIHQVALGAPSEGTNLVIWANQPLPNFNVASLIPRWLEDKYRWGFRLSDSFGSVEMLLPGEAFVIKNYKGLGTFPHRGISFTDENGEDTRVFFFTENGDRLVIREIEADLADYGFDPSNKEDYAIIINGVGFVRNADNVYTMTGEQLPTHVTSMVLRGLGIHVTAGGSQRALQQNGVSLGVGYGVVNYLTSGADRVVVGINDTFMSNDRRYFAEYIPISLLRHLGFDVHFEGGRVHIDGQVNLAINPHPLAIAMQNFIASAEGETRAFVTSRFGGRLSVVAIEYADTFITEATLFIPGVIYREIESFEGFPFSIGVTADGVAVNPATSRDEIVYSFTIYAESTDDYYLFHHNWPEFSITEDEFYLIRAGMVNSIISRDLRDGTEEILAMVKSTW